MGMFNFLPVCVLSFIDFTDSVYPLEYSCSSLHMIFLPPPKDRHISSVFNLYMNWLQCKCTVKVAYSNHQTLYACMGLQLARGECWDLINRFVPSTVVYLCPARSWIVNVICRGILLCSGELRWEVIVCFVYVVDYHCLSILFILIFHT